MSSGAAEAVAKITQHLDVYNGSSISDATSACFALCLLIQQPLQSGVDFASLQPKLVNLLDKQDDDLQSNVLSAIAGLIEVDDAFVEQFVSDSTAAAQKIVDIFNTSKTEVVRLNALTALGALAESSPQGVEQVLAVGTLSSLLTGNSTPDQSANMQEACVDTICKLCAHSDAAKVSARELNAVTTLAALLKPTGGTMDVNVRVLLALGMLLEGDEASAIHLAEAPGAVTSLLALMKQDMDGDCQQIAASLFVGLSKGSTAVKETMAATMRAEFDNSA